MYYQATIVHHSISRARTVQASSLAAIKRKASREFGDGFNDHKIVVHCYDPAKWVLPVLVAYRLCGERRWTSWPIES